ncbi:rab gtpase-activating protein 1-isoform 10-like isoform x1 [Stylonychia lemnae]|uniref:Rab gtpase-activating protein 1-isoform 10-like isoform x1 n=1 Tax=Stylonychia lemnae TaxID=5949 RepID=A0A078AAD6_STYLE|nr:rab gtpase-activating protein 1-isoform 10-like isoform x1 [Stylonychia lemnae]|eukprot:CDW79154.1 rab gtpase-activating protein 1-isoform 10-like isoform x1 [Stylonychia lemnae]
MQQQSQLELEASNSTERARFEQSPQKDKHEFFNNDDNTITAGGLESTRKQIIQQKLQSIHTQALSQSDFKGNNLNNVANVQGAKKRKKRHREISMSDIMPKFENTQSMLENTNYYNYNSTITNTLMRGLNGGKLSFLNFIKLYPNIEELSFIGFYTALDIMTIRLLCRDCALIFNEDLQFNMIRIGNLDDQIRINFWLLQAPFFDIENELKKLLNLGSIFANVYEHLKQMQVQDPTLAFLLPDIGYCQGMNFVAAVLFSYLKDEELTFDIFLSLLASKDLKPLYVNGVPEYHIRNFMLEHLVKQHLPEIFYHFRRLQLNIEVITGQWLMTFFCGYFHYDSMLQIIDNFFIDDWLAVFRISLALLKMFKDDILSNNDLAFVASYFHQLKDKTETIPMQELLYQSLEFNINEDTLDMLESQYFLEQAKKKLVEDQSKWDVNETHFLSQITNFIKKSEPPLKKEIQSLQKKLIQIDHELKKQVQITSMAKMEYEQAQEVKDHILEKKNILYGTYTTLKRDIHTRKQMHKMTILAQILKKRRDQTVSASVDYNMSSDPEEGGNSDYQDVYQQPKPKHQDDWNYQSQIMIEKQETPQKHAQSNQRIINTETFDPKKNAKEIKELEMDVQRIEHRMKENEYLCNIYETTFSEKKSLYEIEKQRFDDQTESKDKLMNQINGLMMAFEASKQQKLSIYAEYLRENYREKYKIEF